MRQLSFQSFSFRALLVACAWAVWAPGLSAVTISEVEAGNVTPFSFMLTWQVSEETLPALEIYADSEGTEAVTTALTLEYYPLNTGDPAVSSDYFGRQQRRSLEAELKGRGRVLVRVSDAQPGTTYHVRPVGLDSQGNDITANGPLPLMAVTTAQENAFIQESRQLVIGFSASAPGQSLGALARVQVDGLAYPLFAVVGDGGNPEEAFFNLDNLLDAAGQTNLNSSSPLDLEITLLGNGVVPGTMDYTVPYGGGFVTADAILAPYNPVAPVVDTFAFDPIGAQQTGTAFTITIRALDARGKLLESFNSTADLSANLPLSEGAGTTPAFTDGVLSGYSVAVSEAGQARLTATETGGTAAGSSNEFDVAGVIWTLLTEALPSVGGSVTGGGTYADGASAAITAVAADRYIFQGWNGSGIANPDSAGTTVLMDADKTVTALFVEDPVIQDYAEWSSKLFGENPPAPELTVPERDYDFDGISNLMEYASGTDPLVSDSDSVVPLTAITQSGAPVISYVRRGSSEDLQYFLQVSSLNGSWSTYSPDPADIAVIDLGDDLEEVTVTLSDRINTSTFIRLVVTLQEN